MAIKGLTNRGAAFAQIGNIRKGAKVTKNGVERPIDLKYFRVDIDELEKDRSAKFLHVYGAQPTEINILIPFDEIDRCWDAWCEAYTAGRMVARSDGEYFLYLVDLATGEVVVQNGSDKNGNRVPHKTVIGRAGKSEIKCKPVGRLKVIVPELQSAAYLVVHTTSFHDIKNISEQLEGIKMLNGGHLVGIPMVLRRRPKMVSVPKPDGTRVRLEKWLLSIEADPNWVSAMLTKLQQAALPMPVSVVNPGLPASTPSTDHEQEPEGIPDGVFEDEEDDDFIEDEYRGEDIQSTSPNVKVEVVAPIVSTAKDLGGKIEPLRYQPAALKVRIDETATLKPNEKANVDRRRIIKTCLVQALGSEEKTIQVLNWLVGKQNIDDVPDAVAAALFSWLAPMKDSGGLWTANSMAEREAQAVLLSAQPQQNGFPF